MDGLKNTLLLALFAATPVGAMEQGFEAPAVRVQVVNQFEECKAPPQAEVGDVIAMDGVYESEVVIESIANHPECGDYLLVGRCEYKVDLAGYAEKARAYTIYCGLSKSAQVEAPSVDKTISRLNFIMRSLASSIKK